MFKISLTAARINAGYTLEEVAEKLHKSKPTIIAYEKGKAAIDVYTFNELCELYKVPKEYIILPRYSTQSGKENKNPQHDTNN